MVAPAPAPASSRLAWLSPISFLKVVGVAVVLLVAAERLWTLVHAPPTYFDDAYMFLRYAHNLLDGYGLRWNRGEPPVYGATSLPHVLVVALVRWAGPTLSNAAVLQISSGVAAVLLVVALVLTCARFAQHPSLRAPEVGSGARCWWRCSRTPSRFSFTRRAGWTPCWRRWPTRC